MDFGDCMARAPDRSGLLLIAGLFGCVLERLGLSFALLFDDVGVAFRSFLGGLGRFFEFIRAILELGLANLFLFGIAGGEDEGGEGNEDDDLHGIDQSCFPQRQDG